MEGEGLMFPIQVGDLFHIFTTVTGIFRKVPGFVEIWVLGGPWGGPKKVEKGSKRTPSPKKEYSSVPTTFSQIGRFSTLFWVLRGPFSGFCPKRPPTLRLDNSPDPGIWGSPVGGGPGRALFGPPPPPPPSRPSSKRTPKRTPQKDPFSTFSTISPNSPLGKGFFENPLWRENWGGVKSRTLRWGTTLHQETPGPLKQRSVPE